MPPCHAATPSTPPWYAARGTRLRPRRTADETQELNYPFLLAELDRLGWAGHIGCEVDPLLSLLFCLWLWL